MTVDEVRARRDEVLEMVRKYGVDRLTVAVAEPGTPLPDDYEVYFEVGFTPDAKAATRGVAYVNALTDMAEELSELLGHQVLVGEIGADAGIHVFAQEVRERAAPL